MSDIKISGKLASSSIQLDSAGKTSSPLVFKLTLDKGENHKFHFKNDETPVSEVNYTICVSIKFLTLEDDLANDDWTYKKNGDLIYILANKEIEITNGNTIEIPLGNPTFNNYRNNPNKGSFKCMSLPSIRAQYFDFKIIPFGNQTSSNMKSGPFIASVHGTLSNSGESNSLFLYLINQGEDTIHFIKDKSIVNLSYYADEGSINIISKPDALSHQATGEFALDISDYVDTEEEAMNSATEAEGISAGAQAKLTEFNKTCNPPPAEKAEDINPLFAKLKVQVAKIAAAAKNARAHATEAQKATLSKDIKSAAQKAEKETMIARFAEVELKIITAQILAIFMPTVQLSVRVDNVKKEEKLLRISRDFSIKKDEHFKIDITGFQTILSPRTGNLYVKIEGLKGLEDIELIIPVQIINDNPVLLEAVVRELNMKNQPDAGGQLNIELKNIGRQPIIFNAESSRLQLNYEVANSDKNSSNIFEIKDFVRDTTNTNNLMFVPGKNKEIAVGESLNITAKGFVTDIKKENINFYLNLTGLPRNCDSLINIPIQLSEKFSLESIVSNPIYNGIKKNSLRIYIHNTGDKTISFTKDTSQIILKYKTNKEAFDALLNASIDDGRFNTGSGREGRFDGEYHNEYLENKGKIKDVRIKYENRNYVGNASFNQSDPSLLRATYEIRENFKLAPREHITIEIDKIYTRYEARKATFSIEFKDVEESKSIELSTHIQILDDPTPIGSIMMWSGYDEYVPDGWVVCDGRIVHGLSTPDIRGSFVVGADPHSNRGIKIGKKSSHKVRSEGGEEKVTLSVEQIPSHNHLMRDYTLNNWDRLTLQYGRNLGTDHYSTVISGEDKSSYSATNGKHTDPQGSGASHENMPPYYALFFIMKVN